MDDVILRKRTSEKGLNVVTSSVWNFSIECHQTHTLILSQNMGLERFERHDEGKGYNLVQAYPD